MSHPLDVMTKGLAALDRAAADNPSAATTDRAKVKQLAEQFESMLITQMLREMRESMAPDSDEEGLGGSIMGDTVNQELGLSLSKQGGVGLADQLMKSLERQQLGSDPQPASELRSGAFSPTFPGLGSDPKVVSSDFGWRNDPINGQHKFHAGVDLRVAYGQEVRSASSGVVKSAGNQGGYGLTVVVDHGDGVETRYAHLSSIDVRVGSVVGAGQPIARSGNSGRSTGAHLHFEVRKDGQPVDPEDVTGLVPIADM